MSSITINSDLTQLPNGFYKLAITTSSEDMPAAVFAIEVLPTSRDPLAVPYRFSHVCRLTDLLELPAEPDPDKCYFRTDDIEMILDTLDIATKTNKIIRSDINELVKEYNTMNDPEITGTTVTISGIDGEDTEMLNRVFYLGHDING